MVCVYCSKGTQVINSRRQKKPNQVWRRRRCLSCQSIFSSIEAVDWAQAVRIKHKDSLEPFSRDTLLISVYEACKHRKTAVSDATSLVTAILGKLWPQIDTATLSRQQIVKTTHDVLKRFDKAAAIHYLAYHPIDDGRS